MSGRKSHPIKVSEIMGDMLDKLGLSQKLTQKSVLEKWPSIVGPKMAKHTQAVDCRDGILFVSADHGAWRQELMLLAPMIIHKYNEATGEETINEIRLNSRQTYGRKRKNKA